MLRAAVLCGAASAAHGWGTVASTDEQELATPTLSDELISEVNSDPSSTWVAGRNARFEGTTLKEAKKLMGTLQSEPSEWLPHRPIKFVDIPDEFDWRTDPRAANCPSVKEIRDQSNCGSCWAFGSVEAMTDRICIASGGKQTTHLSAQDLAACCKLGDMGCDGGVPPTAYTYYKTNGIVSGGNYGDKSGCLSYQLAPCAHHSNSTKYPACGGSTMLGLCPSKCKDNTALTWADDKHHGTGGYSVCKQGMNGACADAMAQDVYQNGPITAQFFVFQSFESYKSGVYQKTKLTDLPLGGHAIKILGYGTDGDVPYWLVANSWNEDWGMGGFFKILRGKNNCQIEDAMINGGPVAGEPQL